MRKKDILFFISEAARTGEEIVAFLSGAGIGGGANIARGIQFVKEVRRHRVVNTPDKESQRKETIRVRRLIQALKEDGLLESKKNGKTASYLITKKGRGWLEDRRECLPEGIWQKEYESIPASRVTIIAYDIPYRLRGHRDWLRDRILGMGFHFLQRSVFLGKIKIPIEFLDDLEELRISDYVEIFEITKEGTLRVPGVKSRTGR